MPKGSLIGCGVIAALLTIAFLFWIPFGGAERSDVRAEAQKVLRLIRNGQTSAISGHFSTAPQLEIDWTTIEADIKELDLTGYVAWQENELRNHSSPEYGYTLEGNATARDGQVVPLTLEFVQNYPFWKLRSIRRSSPDRAQPASQPKKNAATGG